MKKGKLGKDEFWQKIKPPNPLFLFKGSPISIIFNDVASGKPYPWPVDSYLKEDPREAPFRLIDAINEGNQLLLRIDLNHHRETLEMDFSKLLTVSFKELKKHNRERSRIPEREWDSYLKAYELRENKKLTFLEIGKRMFPRDFKITKEGSKTESAEKKARRFYNEAKKLIGEGKLFPG
jgi:hypothetical protein